MTEMHEVAETVEDMGWMNGGSSIEKVSYEASIKRRV